jgi:benzodiazapine receptor
VKTDYKKLAAAILVCLSAGFIGSFFTLSSIPTWYATIQKPAFNPPNWVFGPVWTTLYILMGISAYMVWMKGWDKKEVRNALAIFAVQLVLNTLWSVIFFGANKLFYSFVVIVFLWMAIAANIFLFNRISRNAALLMVPYLAWVSFAAFLNYSIWQLNMLL